MCIESVASSDVWVVPERSEDSVPTCGDGPRVGGRWERDKSPDTSFGWSRGPEDFTEKIDFRLVAYDTVGLGGEDVRIQVSVSLSIRFSVLGRRVVCLYWWTNRTGYSRSESLFPHRGIITTRLELGPFLCPD